MTKIAIKGPATGTGTYTLNAPDTDAALDLELPITGTHLASAQADGMPLGPGGDPVVESGSNSDGFWARWADRTQICRNNYTTGFKPPTTTYKRGYWSYPVTFIDNLVDTVAVAGESTTEHNTDRFVNINTGERESGIGTKIKAYTNGSLNFGFGVLLVAHGRWK